jgi:hypothetical protein
VLKIRIRRKQISIRQEVLIGTSIVAKKQLENMRALSLTRSRTPPTVAASPQLPSRRPPPPAAAADQQQQQFMRFAANLIASIFK